MSQAKPSPSKGGVGHAASVKSQRHKRRSQLYNRLLRIARPAAKTIPVVGTIIEGSLETAVEVSNLHQDVSKQPEECRGIRMRACGRYEELEGATVGNVLPSSTLEHVGQYLRNLHDIENAMAKMENLSKFNRLLRLSEIQDEAKTCERVLHDACEVLEIKVKFFTASRRKWTGFYWYKTSIPGKFRPG
ncbi:hypothetical protein PUNSTDRAFT_130397 [Punctularia strigosozonata HHB-11173 SS5]|uniref:uncharacterized protein n=1 Tax=Punctularia strigosozonata (strain HHB-11173) TaxID=741275 RepID=UPI0004417169|nr:uncharacterized protein PUNSTDRAFT_130397 [Punctularia strigosozonata HHB-11173 SS5]EIN12126.1 hypothetical protein PUNSTDRAFT_130397 [Punctularia strigosozonata HHB-11173 SS5]